MRRRLIIVCGLPGAGKTTHAKALASGLGAVRFSPDEWMDALAIDLYDEERRARIEALQDPDRKRAQALVWHQIFLRIGPDRQSPSAQAACRSLRQC